MSQHDRGSEQKPTAVLVPCDLLASPHRHRYLLGAMAHATRIRLLAPLGLALLLAAPLACGTRSDVPNASCQAVPWGGWDGTPHCAGLGAAVISGQDRGCQQHSDCVLIGANRCSAHSVNQAALGHMQQLQAPCDHPLSLTCPPSPRFAMCYQGCCVPSQTPPPATP